MEQGDNIICAKGGSVRVSWEAGAVARAGPANASALQCSGSQDGETARITWLTWGGSRERLLLD